MKRFLALVYGIFCYALFLGTLLYAIGFVGNVGVPKSIDSGSAPAPLTAALMDALLLSLFAIQHSVMARHRFKQQWTRVVSWYLERSTFVLAATLALALVLWQWRPIPRVIWDLRGTASGSLLAILSWTGWGVLLLSTFLINHFELFGLEQVWAYFRQREFHRPPFKTPLFYAWVRHPVYLGFIIAFWSAPVMTAGHLLFAIATTGYILVGISYEERDLIRIYGEAYRDYRRRVPMLFPWRRRAPELPEQADRQAA
ncbi:MAG: isoprenylcysteine carboxylmethyltransferase family protein [Acidobacteriales bacterium]|nr:isoprenylcysteine carboxylmethyltransferase family protein [Candidatus Koribacter versatilis]MBI3644891.1 isoprenylcysteine carboxylmethyltransferase family protein [Terriglobales bacterium]